MVDTRQLITELAAQAGPVRPLASPVRRTLFFVAAAIALVGLLAFVMGFRPDLRAALSEPFALAEWSAALLTGLLAARAVFEISVPGRSPQWAWLPAPALIAWFASIGFGCLGDWLRMGPAAFAFASKGAMCFAMITMISLPLLVALAVMVRHAGAVRPVATLVLGSLSAAALAAAGVSLMHSGDTALMVLLWHGGGVATVALIAVIVGRPLLALLGPRRPT